MHWWTEFGDGKNEYGQHQDTSSKALYFLLFVWDKVKQICGRKISRTVKEIYIQVTKSVSIQKAHTCPKRNKHTFGVYSPGWNGLKLC